MATKSNQQSIDMKKKLMLVGGIICLMVALVRESDPKDEMPTVTLENIEALASEENWGQVICYGEGSVDCNGYWVDMKFIL